MATLEALPPTQLLRLVQIELRCVQDATLLFEDTVPDCVCALLRPHAETARHLSEILWTHYHLPVHGHPPSVCDW